MSNENQISTDVKELSIAALLSQAVDKGLPVESIERLNIIRKELKAEWAKEEFIKAMAGFQSECPIINRDSIVKDKQGKERYKFAKLDAIVSQTKEIIAKNNLSYKFEEEKDEKYATVICIVTHTAGHSERTAFKVEIGNEEFMTNTQKYGARMTFAKRYAFCNAFGVFTGDEDNDAADDGEEDEQKLALEFEAHKDRLTKAKDLQELSKIWLSLPAAAKGQLFTIKEELKKKYENTKV